MHDTYTCVICVVYSKFWCLRGAKREKFLSSAGVQYNKQQSTASVDLGEEAKELEKG
jgi:hypothetical protein